MVELIVLIALILGSLAGIVTSITLLWTKVIRPLWRFIKRVGVLTETMSDLPEWCESVDLSLAQLHPNSGSSLRDDITVIRGLIEEHINDNSLHVRTSQE
jgi:hypothetical protein